MDDELMYFRDAMPYNLVTESKPACKSFRCKGANNTVWKRLHKREIPFPYAFSFSEDITSCIRCQESDEECLLFEPEWICNERQGPIVFMAINNTGSCFPLHAETESLCIMQITGTIKITIIPREVSLSNHGLRLITNTNDPHWRHIDDPNLQEQVDWSSYDIPIEDYELSPGDGLRIPYGTCYYLETLSDDCVFALASVED